jgi:four helix bundle protein
VRDHTKLRAFVLADEVALLTYGSTRDFPRNEMYGLTAQMRRAAVSVPSNIVEGCSRESEAEFLRFLDIAFGSLRELRYQSGLARRLGYLETEIYRGFDEKLVEAEKVLSALIRTVRGSSKTPG